MRRGAFWHTTSDTNICSYIQFLLLAAALNSHKDPLDYSSAYISCVEWFSSLALVSLFLHFLYGAICVGYIVSYPSDVLQLKAAQLLHVKSRKEKPLYVKFE